MYVITDGRLSLRRALITKDHGCSSKCVFLCVISFTHLSSNMSNLIYHRDTRPRKKPHNLRLTFLVATTSSPLSESECDHDHQGPLKEGTVPSPGRERRRRRRRVGGQANGDSARGGRGVIIEPIFLDQFLLGRRRGQPAALWPWRNKGQGKWQWVQWVP